MTDFEFVFSPFTIAIYLDHEEKLYKREVYSTLSMVGDIGGLFDGLLIVAGFLVTPYNASMFELSVSKILFKFQQTPAPSSQKI